MLKGLGGLGDMAKMMKAAQDLQGKMASLQDDLANIIMLGESVAGWSKPAPLPRAI
jgi:nucleoid-associated protein EbfC